MTDQGKPDRADSTTEHRADSRYPSFLPSIEAICLVLFAGLLIWKGIIPAWRTLNTDFPNYYLVARLVHEGWNLDRIYDWIWLQRVKDHWGVDQQLVAFAGLTPFSALPILPYAAFSALEAKRLWILTNIFFLFATVEILVRVTQLGRRRVWLLTLLAVLPLRTSFLDGQMHILVLLLLVLAYFCHRRNKSIACGFFLSIAGALKVYPLLFAFYFLWKRRWREVASMAGSSLILLGISYAWMGGHINHIYLTEILPRSMQGEVLDPYNVRAASAAAFLHRLFLFEPGLNPAPLWNSPTLYAVFYPLWQLVILIPLFAGIRTSSGQQDSEKVEWAAFLFSLLLLSPVPSSYHFVVMILSVTLFADVFIRRKQYLYLLVAGALYFFICIAGLIPMRESTKLSPLMFLNFARLWAGILLWFTLVLYLWREHKPLQAIKIRALPAWQLATVAVVIWIAGIVSYHRHFAYFEKDINARIQLPIHTILATGIRAEADGFLFTAIAPQGYRVLNQQGHEAMPEIAQASPSDQLSSAVAANRPLTLLERADATGSRVIEANPADTQGTPLQIAHAETPAISADGSLVAYIKEDRGRGSLWIAHLQTEAGQSRLATSSQAVEDAYDVRDVTFTSSGNIVFTARRDGKTSIFKMDAGGKPTPFIAGNEDVEAPAFSPDGQFVAFRKLLRNRWQLVMEDLTNRQERPLTFGDCNAYSPEWMNQTTIAYATDCGRGLGLTALAQIHVDR